eukprot:scaffold18874_cov35-Attheya_sp.AAC.1
MQYCCCHHHWKLRRQPPRRKRARALWSRHRQKFVKRHLASVRVEGVHSILDATFGYWWQCHPKMDNMLEMIHSHERQ